MSSRTVIKYIFVVIAVIFVITGIKISAVYRNIYGKNIKTPENKDIYLYIKTGSGYDDVIAQLNSLQIIKNKETFTWAAEKKNYSSHIHPGRYRIRNNMSNNELLNILRAGLQEPVNVVVNSVRTVDDLAEKVSDQIEAEKDDIILLLKDDAILKHYGFNLYTIPGMFVPNTYEFWWNTDAEGFLDRMYKEYDHFWNSEKKRKAEEINLTPNQVITLASIIISETNKTDEYRRIAGVYMNRLKTGMKLQADPTVKFALNDFERQRILTRDIDVDSPYNTYKFYGLPPGPIAIPDMRAIDAVLNYERNDYLYFCAKEDFSGYHNFARTLEQHNKNARLYQRALNRQRIMK